jgi:putative ABC transport system permease protein
MKAIDRMLVVEAKRMWRQGLAICVLLACGVGVFVMSGSTMTSLEASCQDYYTKGRFANVFVQLVRAPNRLAERIRTIEGVRRVQTRIVRDVLLDVPQMVEPASCRLVSIEGDPSTSLNRVFLRQGRFPKSTGRVEVIASELFAEAHGLGPGDHFDAIMGGRRERLHIVGIGLSPEFVYVVQPGLLVTDDRRFGVLWMPRRQMAAAFNMEGAFNSLSMTVQSGANVAEIQRRVDRLTRPFGGTDSYDREDQESHRRVSDEIHQVRTMAYVTPSIFLAVSAFLFNIVFSRLVQQQKEQIATLRAFGYTPREIGLHYVKLVVLLVSLGSLVGLLAGIWLSDWMLGQYARFFRFPNMYHLFAFDSASLSILTSLGVALAGTFSSIRRATRLVPAEAMRPEAPKDYRGLWTERLGIAALLSPITRMIVRRLETNARATTLSVLGMSLGLAVLMLGSFMEDTVDYVIELEFERAQRQDVMLTFNETLSAEAVFDVTQLPGVTRSEPFRSVPVRISHDRHTKRVGLLGLETEPELFRILDDQERPVPLPPQGGLTMSEKLAALLDVRAGDRVTVEILEGQRESREIPVARIFPNFTSPGVYMNRDELHRLLRESEQISGVYLSVQPGKMLDLYQAVKETPTVAGVMDTRAAMKNFRDLVSESTSIMRTVNAIFAMLIAFGVIYNCSMIILAERSRDLATLRVMGFTRREAAWVLLGEIFVITLLAIPVGIPIGYGFAYLTTLALDTETHRFPLIIDRSTYAYSTTVILIAAAVSGLYVRRMVNHLDLISVLKVKD